MKGKVCLVTGASSGVGHSVAGGLAAAGATVVMLVRDEATGARAVAALRHRVPEARVEPLVGDLSDLATIRSAAAVFRDRYDRLDVLAAVAGVLRPRRELSADGWEMTFAVNHLGHVLLALELESRMAGAAPSRYLAVGGNPGLLQRADLSIDDLARREQSYSLVRVAIETMLCRVIWTQEAARRWAGVGIRANVFFPGLVRSRLGRGLPAPLRLAAAVGGLVLPRVSPTGLRACMDPQLAEVTGSYIVRRGAVPFSSPRIGPDQAAALWEMSARLVGK